MVCQEVVFANAACRIEIEPRPYALNGPNFAALMYVFDDDGAAIRPVMFKDGRRVEVHGASEALALNSAIALLEAKFGAITEYAHGCTERPLPPAPGQPFILTE
jgi:hypothetical protein